MRRYERHLNENRWWMFKDIPRRADLRPYEAIYHFNLYMYLVRFLSGFDGQLYPEFPTGNGQIDLVIKYAGMVFGLEVKNFSTMSEHKKGIQQAARYGQQLGLSEISLIVFVEEVKDKQRDELEQIYVDEKTKVQLKPVFVRVGEGS